MAKVQDRIMAFEHIYTGNVVTSTKVYFANGGKTLLLAGCFHFPYANTLEIRYEPAESGQPATVKKITLLSG